MSKDEQYVATKIAKRWSDNGLGPAPGYQIICSPDRSGAWRVTLLTRPGHETVCTFCMYRTDSNPYTVVPGTLKIVNKAEFTKYLLVS